MDAAALAAKPMAEIEEWFLGAVEATPLETGPLLVTLRELGRDPERRPALESWADLLHDRLKKESNWNAGVDLIELRADWSTQSNENAVKAVCAQRVADLFARTPGGRHFAEAAGINGAPGLTESFRRLRVLLALKPGVFCAHRSLGGGTVRRLDDFYAKVTVDFPGRPGHEMSFAYAAESLTIPGEGHLLTLRHRDPDGLAALVRDNPAAVVKMALQSYGNMPAARLQEALADIVEPAPGWKPFWESARKALQASGEAVIPTRKGDAIRLVEMSATPAQRWVERLREERRLDRLTQLFEALSQDAERPGSGEEGWEDLLRTKMMAVISGAGDGQPELAARTLLAAGELGVRPEGADEDGFAARWREPAALARLLNTLPVRLLASFVQLVTRNFQTGVDVLPGLISNLNLSPMGELIGLLRERGLEEPLRDSLREVTYARKENIRLLCWMARNLDLVEAWELAPLFELPFRVVDGLRANFSGEDLRAANALRKLLDDKEWLRRTLGVMDEVRRRDFVRVVRQQDAAMYYDNQALLGRAVALFPELADLLRETEEPPAAGGVTSWRAYRRRQNQLENLIRVEIPRNARDIEVARSYGDLRENHEYKTAKETQGLLMRRQEEWQRDLQTVKGTDFAGCDASAAGMGTEVELERMDDGTREIYRILGEWDHDMDLNIISCKSRLALLLEGRQPGDPVELPQETGGVAQARVAAVRPLPPAVLEWARSPAETAADSPLTNDGSRM